MFFNPAPGPSQKRQGGEFCRLLGGFNTSSSLPPLQWGGLTGVNLGARRIGFNSAYKRVRSSPLIGGTEGGQGQRRIGHVDNDRRHPGAGTRRGMISARKSQ